MSNDLSAEPTTIHLVPHTHWDREWYRPFQSFRMQLVDLVDRVLDMLESEPDFAFTLDGQLATIDDYLEIRREQADRIRGHVESGRLAIGPWQILMDEFLVSGETLVRNLERGWARAEDFGGPMKVGYLPDMFGHVAQMPQLLRRAGLTDAVVWRGIPGAIDRHAFRWESPDGSWVRAEYLPAGYGNAAYLFAAPEALEPAAERFAEWARPWFGADPVLAMYGTDHTAPVPELAGLVSRLNEVQAAARMRISTLAQYIDGAPRLTEADPCWRGEMRSGARANVLMGVASARIDIKQAAGRAERALERYAEPLTALHVAPDAWPAAFLRLAWGKVIENSAHDSICGCSIDPVVAQVLVRFAEADQVATTLARRAAVAVAVAAPRGSIVVLNPTPARRHGLVEAQVRVREAWASVALELPDGTRVATQELTRKEAVLFDSELRGDDAADLFRRFHGREIFDHAWNGYRIDDRTITFEVDSDPNPIWLDVDGLRAEVMHAMGSAADKTWRIRILAAPRRTLAAMVPVPALGWTAARAVEGDVQQPHPVDVDADRLMLSNGLLSVRVRPDGTLDLETPGRVRAVGIGRIVDGGDVGDSYNYGPPAADRVVDTPSRTTVEADLHGPIRGRLLIRRRYDWPAGAGDENRSRSDDLVATDVLTEVELRAGEPFVRVAVSFDNQSDDHRVRFHAPLPRRADGSHAEGQFAVVERGLVAEGGYREEPLTTYPAHGWVDAGGLAILLDHLSEYEVTAGGTELALTILRSTGLISRNDHPYRQDPAGPEIEIPDAQMRGRWRMTFGLYPHDGGWSEGDVSPAAERYRHDLVVTPGAGQPAEAWPPEAAGADALAVDGDDVVLTSLRRRDDGWLEARLVNLGSAARRARIGPHLVEARDASLRGEPGDQVPVDEGHATPMLGPSEIRTIQLRRRESSLGRAEVLDVAGPRQSI